MTTNSKNLVTRDDCEGVTTLTLRRSEAYNALSDELIDALTQSLETVAKDLNSKVVILRGEGRGFCAGHDLKQLTQDNNPDRQKLTFTRCSTLMQTINQLPQPVIAEVHGIATAAGCQLVASCDLAVAEQGARFATPGVNIGLFCSTPMVALSRTVSQKHAMEMLLLGEMITAQRAYEMGLINRVVKAEALEQTTQAIARNIASKSGNCVRTGKQAFYRQLHQPLADAYSDCSDVMGCNIQHQDAIEGIDAFLNKRPPVWSS